MKQITVAAAIILNEQNQLLLVRKNATEYFMQVGGKLEPNELPEQTMLREIHEEIGAKANLKSFVGRFETLAANEKDHQLISYVYQVELNESPRIDAEIAEMKWIDLDDRETLIAPLTKEIVIPWCQQYLKSAHA
ncbi:NUDIX hydrolase [Acinetobacter shaoyimingii]|uniref:NUDIX domain-containing protein n=1 Tax=Acinetobacter shaoyimingii TaxID=2715164 RepID=A0A6G8RSG1_9GAMM|nr:NUDIX domain-containing protein [Acinetobacter shaoyimingii]QIO04825.1 NUDIX domain-containing protein [Acinetobacter shaoyimingii]